MKAIFRRSSSSTSTGPSTGRETPPAAETKAPGARPTPPSPRPLAPVDEDHRPTLRAVPEASRDAVDPYVPLSSPGALGAIATSTADPLPRSQRRDDAASAAASAPLQGIIATNPWSGLESFAPAVGSSAALRDSGGDLDWRRGVDSSARSSPSVIETEGAPPPSPSGGNAPTASSASPSPVGQTNPSTVPRSPLPPSSSSAKAETMRRAFFGNFNAKRNPFKPADPSVASTTTAAASDQASVTTHRSVQPVETPQQSFPAPPTHLLAGYSQPPAHIGVSSPYYPSTTNASRSIAPPSTSSLALTPSLSPGSFASAASSTSIDSPAHSPLAAFLGSSTVATADKTADDAITPAQVTPYELPIVPAAGPRSPGSLSDAEAHIYNVFGHDSSNQSTPATSEGGHIEPIRKPTQPVSTLDDILSRYSARPVSNEAAAETNRPLSRSGGPSAGTTFATEASANHQASSVRTPPKSSAALSAPIFSSYPYAGGISAPVLTSLVTSPYPARQTLPQQPHEIPSFSTTGPLRHQSSAASTVSESTTVASDAVGTTASPLPTLAAPFVGWTGGAPMLGPTITHRETPLRSAPPSTSAPLGAPTPASGLDLSTIYSGLGYLTLGNRLQPLTDPTAAQSSQRDVAALRNSSETQPDRGQSLMNELTDSTDASSPLSPIIPLNAALDQADERRLTMLSTGSRDARQRLDQIYAEMAVDGRSSPVPSARSVQVSSTPSTDPTHSPAVTLDVGTSTASSVVMSRGGGGSDADVSTVETEPSSQMSSMSGAPQLTICFGEPRFEYAISTFPRTIFHRIVDAMEWIDLRALREVSTQMRAAFNVEITREYILERYLGKYGYRTLASTDYDGTPSVELSLRDLEAFLTGREFAPAEYAELAREHQQKPLDHVTVRMITAAMRAYNRLAMRCRSQGPPYRKVAPGVPTVYKEGRAACLRVWVPLRDFNWMQDDEVVQCEKSVWRAGVWSLVQRGDVVWNLAQGDFANEGRMISDSKFLRDLSYVYDHVGHLPNWLNSMTFSPAYWHNVLASSDINHPVIYVTLAPWNQQLQSSLVLCKENIPANQSTARYRIQRYVYRAHAEIKPGTLIGAAGGSNGNGPGGIDCIHQDWNGHLIVETEGTTEHAQELMRRCATEAGLTPFRVLREKSRPGKLVIRPVLENECIS